MSIDKNAYQLKSSVDVTLNDSMVLIITYKNFSIKQIVKNLEVVLAMSNVFTFEIPTTIVS